MHKETLHTENLQMTTTNKITSLWVIIGCLYLIVSINSAEAKKEVFYGCKNGFQFESKQKAARCIQQRRLSFQAPQQCNKNGKFFKLNVDYRGKQDMCVAEKNTKLQNEMKLKPKPGAPKPKSSRMNKKPISFAPKCAIGFKLQIRKGKDACSRGKPEQVIAPSKKVTR